VKTLKEVSEKAGEKSLEQIKTKKKVTPQGQGITDGPCATLSGKKEMIIESGS